jgi:hypothetical protein
LTTGCGGKPARRISSRATCPLHLDHAARKRAPLLGHQRLLVAFGDEPKVERDPRHRDFRERAS